MKKGALIFVVMIIAGIAYADTWRYGSPGDVRRAGIRASQYGDRGGYDGHRRYRGYRDHALSTWMDRLSSAVSSPYCFVSSRVTTTGSPMSVSTP